MSGAVVFTETHWYLPGRGQRRRSYTQTLNSTLWDSKAQRHTGIHPQACIYFHKAFLNYKISLPQTGSMFLIPAVVLTLLCTAPSQKAGWIIASAELVRGAVTAERKFHQKQMKLLFLGYEQCL